MSESNNGINKNGWFWNAPTYFNKWRIFPRAFIIFYFWLAYEVAMWFMGIPVPGAAQAGFASAVIGAGAAWFGLYVNSGHGTTSVNVHSQATPDSTTLDHEIKG